MIASPTYADSVYAARTAPARSAAHQAAFDAAMVARDAAKASVGTPDHERLVAEYRTAGAVLGIYADAEHDATLAAARLFGAR